MSIFYKDIATVQGIVVESSKNQTVDNLLYFRFFSCFLKKLSLFNPLSEVKKCKYTNFWIFRIGAYIA